MENIKFAQIKLTYCFTVRKAAHQRIDITATFAG